MLLHPPAHDTQDFVEMVRGMGIRPYVAQDQVSAAYGGFIRSTSKDRTIEVNSILAPQSRFTELEKHLGFYFTGFSRMASEVAQEQPKITPHKDRELNTMLQLVDEAESTLTTRQPSVCEFGRLLHESWQIKRTLTQKITNSNIDEITTLGRVLAS